MKSELCGHTSLLEPELLFHGNRRHKHPLLGLIENGPYGPLRLGTPSSLRLALLAPQRDMSKLKHLSAELSNKSEPKEAINYYQFIPGLRKSSGFKLQSRTIA